MKINHNPKPCVIFADDDADTLAMYQKYGELIGWHVETATTPRELLSMVNALFDSKQRTYDAIVTDINFMNGDDRDTPRLSGYSGAAQIRKAFPDVPIIVVTAYSSFTVKDELKPITAEIITKPAEIDYVFNKIQTAIDFHRISATHYDGQERRFEIVNQTEFTRRRTDFKIQLPRPVSNVIANMQATAHFSK